MLFGCWAVPRSASTAFERMISERGDLDVISEPFAHAYYDGPEARSSRFEATRPDATFANVRSSVLRRAAQRDCFVKDMAYQMLPALDGDVVAAGRHTILVRHPAESIASLARQWPDFTTDEAGFTASAAVVERLDELGAPVLVIDSHDLRRDPERTVAAWCDAVGLPFVAEALRWEPGMRPGWERWSEWHAETAKTSGFVAPPEPASAAGPPDARLQPAIDAALPLYEALVARRIG